MTKYSNEINKVYDRIKDKGLSIILQVKATGGVFDPETETYTESTYANYPTYAVITNVKDSYGGRKDEIQGTKMFLIPAKGLDIVIDPQYQIKVGNDIYEIMNVDIVEPDGSPIMYKCEGKL